MKTMTPRWTPAAGRGVVLVAVAGLLAGCGCAGLAAVAWRLLDQATGLP